MIGPQLRSAICEEKGHQKVSAQANCQRLDGMQTANEDQRKKPAGKKAWTAWKINEWPGSKDGGPLAVPQMEFATTKSNPRDARLQVRGPVQREDTCEETLRRLRQVCGGISMWLRWSKIGASLPAVYPLPWPLSYDLRIRERRTASVRFAWSRFG